MAKNEVWMTFDSCSQNERFARMAAAAFVAGMDPTMEELSDIKTAVSEAVTNCIIHGYEGKAGKIKMHMVIEKRCVGIEIIDEGVGIADVSKAMEPMFTTKPELERSGMGFTFMEAFMDELSVTSKPGEGTHVCMRKKIPCFSELQTIA